MQNNKFDNQLFKWNKLRVVIRGEKSQWLNVYSGVPQGSVIGPILFITYINDLPNGIKSKINIFANDTKMARYNRR